MNTDVKNSFLRDIKKIIDPAHKENVEQAILAVMNAQTTRDIPELKKYKRCKKGISYRIKIGSYRIGVTIVGNVLTFVRCLPRKDIDKYFP